jgi:soluble lytic murein transglycosylase-like protein
VEHDRIVLPREYAHGSRNEFTNEDVVWLIVFYEKIYGLDRFLIAAVMKAESDFDPYAISPAGARGIMQLMPEAASSLGVADSFDPVQNIAGGALYLARQLREFNDLSLALAAYNAGPEAVRKYGGIPPYRETRDFVQRVTFYYRRYAGK